MGEVYNIVADHLTLLTADDGAMDITLNARDITVSWCLFSGSELTQLIKYGVQRRISIHHNVYANATPKGERNPLAWGDLADLDYVKRERRSYYTAEAHVRYLRELRAGDTVRVTIQLLGYDPKRMHYFEQLFHATEGWMAATLETMALHVDMDSKKTTPASPLVAARLAEMRASHALLPIPEAAGRRIDMPAQG